MASLPARSTLFFAFALATAAAQELPKRSGPANSAPETKLILTDVPDVPMPRTPSSLETQPPLDVARLEAAVESAKKSAASRQRLWKAGVLSKLEAEQAEMKVVRLTRDLENARLEAAKRDAESQRKSPTDEAAKNALAQAEARVATAAAAAQEANAKWDEAQRAAAELRVQRERKLVALGADPKLALKQAEAALQKLSTPPHP